MTQQEIKELRKLLKMTQQQFAVELGMATSTIARWELGLSHPSPVVEKNLLKLSKLAKKNCQEKSIGH